MKKETLANRSSYLVLILALMFFLGIMLNSCIKDNLDFDKLVKTEWNPELALPLVTAELSIEDILKDEESDFLNIDANNFITLVYEDNLISLKANEAILIPDQLFNYSFQSGVSLPSLPVAQTQVLPTNTNLVDFDMGPTNQVDSIQYNSGDFTINFSSTFQHDLTINFSIPSATKNGVTLSQIVNLVYTGSSPVSASVNFSIGGYTVDLTNGGSTFNKMLVQYDVTITGKGNPLNATDEITIDGSFSNLDFAAIFGFLDISNLSTSVDTVDLSVFDAASGFGAFTLVNPTVQIKLSSSIGVETNASFSILEGVNTNIGSSTDLATNPDIPNPLPIPAPNFSQIGQTLSDSFLLSNAGVVSFINDQPNKLIYGVDVQTAGSAGQQSFILDTSKFEVNAKVTMPLYGTADLFVLRDTVDFSLGSIDELESLEVRIRIDNGFPMDVYMQLYMLDSNNVLLDSLLPPDHILLGSGVVDALGEIISSTRLETDIIFTSDKLTNLQKTHKLEVKGRASTANNATTNVKFYADHKISLKMGAKAKFLTEIELNGN